MASGVRDDLGSLIELTYNGYQLPSNLLIVGFQTRGVPDRAGRTFVGLRHSLTVKFWLNTYTLTDGVATLDDWADVNLPTIRTTLMKPGAQLHLVATTFGTYTINATDQKGLRDLQWGPIPEDFSWKPYGEGYAAEVTWRVSWMMNACDNQQQNSDILEWTYSLDFSIDQSGYTTRTYKGQVSIPLTRTAVNGRSLADQADRLREKITPPLPIGFRRKSFSFPLSEDKRTLNFSIVDEQMPPNIPPPGCVIAEASHTVETDPKILATTNHTIRASYEITSDRSRREAFNHFMALVKDRQSVARQNKRALIPLRLHMGEPEIYGRKAADFSVTYRVIHRREDKNALGRILDLVNTLAGGNPKVQFLDEIGLWRPAPESNWKQWSDSLIKSKVMTPRGTAGMKFDKSEDVIIDVCATKPPQPAWEKVLKHTKPPKIRVKGAEEERIDPEDSFLEYQLFLEVQPIDNTLLLQPLPTAAIQHKPASTSATAQTGYAQPYQKAPSAIVQYRAAPQLVLLLWGRALRAGYEITPPQVVSYGGQTPVPANDETCFWRAGCVANYGIPVFAARWRFRYLLPALPTQAFVSPANPLYGGTSQGKKEDSQMGFVTKG